MQSLINILIFVALVLGGAAAILRFMGEVIDRKEAKRLDKFVLDNWRRSKSTPAVQFVRKPIAVLNRAFDAVFGRSIASLKAFVRITILGNLLLFASLSFAGIFSDITLSGFAPWNLAKINGTLAPTIDKAMEKNHFNSPTQTAFLSILRSASWSFRQRRSVCIWLSGLSCD